MFHISCLNINTIPSIIRAITDLVGFEDINLFILIDFCNLMTNMMIIIAAPFSEYLENK